MTDKPRREAPPGAGEVGPAEDAPGAAAGWTASGFGWGRILALMAWGFVVLAFAAGGLADVTDFWWLVLVFGIAAPVVLVASQGRRAPASGAAGAQDRGGEKELLDALKEHGELSPASAAMLTTLTISQASEILETLAREGHLESRARDGSILYALRERDRRILEEPEPAAGEASPQLLPEPLSRRELEVLRLMSLGRTNAQISRELYVAVGTVKAHANNIYRKLDAANRSEAVSKARSLRLLA